MSCRPALHSLPRELCPSNSFPFIRFPTLHKQRRPATPFPSTTSALFLVQRTGRGSHSSPNFPTFKRATFCQCPLLALYFQQLPTIKFSKSRVLITMQIARGVGGAVLKCTGTKFSLPLPRVRPEEGAKARPTLRVAVARPQPTPTVYAVRALEERSPESGWKRPRGMTELAFRGLQEKLVSSGGVGVYSTALASPTAPRDG